MKPPKTHSQRLCIITRLCVVFASLGLCEAAPPAFRAGAATSNITPAIGADPRIRTSRPPATHVHDELHARCLVLDDGQSMLALVVCDLRHISAEVAADAKQIIETMTGIPPHCVVISATHTHKKVGPDRLVVKPL